MRFTHFLLAALALTTAPSLSSATGFHGSIGFSSRFGTCDGPGTCTSCVGLSNCCNDEKNPDYGRCGRGGSRAYNCPDGSKFTCNGGNCPDELVCNFEADQCDAKAHFCWGTITCSGSACPAGYSVGDFCYQDGASAQFKVCGTTTPTTTQPPATQPPATQPPATTAPPIGENPTQPPETTTAPTTPTGPAIPQPGEEPTPADVVCYQEIIGSLTGTYAQVKAALDVWAQLLHTTLGLTGAVELSIGYAQVPDRNSFENGCNGPYDTVADVFVHIQTTGGAEYDRISAALEAFIAANPLTGLPGISCSARSVVTNLPTCGKLPTPTGPAVPQPGEDSVVCYQEIVGSLEGTYDDIKAMLDDWALRAYTTLGLTGPIDVHINFAQVPDRNSFENGCNGPYATVADLFVHISTQNYDGVSAALEAFIAANPLTAYPAITCSARSVTAYIPICGRAPTPAPTLPPLPAIPQPEVPTPANVVCYQEIIGSLTGTYAEVKAALDGWAQLLYTTLGLSGHIGLSINYAQVPDRNSFENGCNGPYATVADVFVHIQTSGNADYDRISAALEAFIAANPLTGLSVISCSARSVVTYLPRCGKLPSTPTAPALPQPGDDSVVCYQEIVGSLTGSYAQVSAAFDDWAQRAYTALGLTGPIDVHINYAQVTDRNSFENGCNGPYATVADLFVHISTQNYAAVSAALEAFIAANPLTAYPVISCSARSVTANIPICGPAPTLPPANNPTQAPETTTAPTTPNLPNLPGANPGGEVPTPANVVCYQEVVGSLTGTYAQISAALDLWEQQMYLALGLTGPIELTVGHAQIPDRQSFENGCNGPYNAMADLFVHIQTTQANYDAVSAALEAFIAANPLTGLSGISCSARSVVTYLPTCGKIPTAPALPQPSDAAVLCYQEVVGSLTGTYAQVSAALDAWQLLMYTTLGLTGPIELTVGHAQIPDRISFENGCNGPYATMADLFIHIPTTFGAYDALSAQLEAFIAANPFTGLNTISCSARSNVAELPSCGKIPNPPVDVPNVPAPNLPQPPQTCPVVGFVPSVVDAGMIEGGKKIYKIVYDITTPDEIISFIDVHITTSLGFFNYRMSLAATATPMQPSYELTFPMYLALGAGESFTYWFTTASTSVAFPREIACDSASFSFTTPGTPNPVPVVPVTPPAACPSVAFDYAIERVGAGEVLNTGVYAITFASATPATTVAWVDVHIHANGGFFNYRMEVDGTGFKQILPSPHLNLATGATVEYWFTYEAGGVTCDTATYAVVV